MIRVYLRDQVEPLEIPDGVAAFPAVRHMTAAPDVVSVQNDAGDVLAWIPMAPVVGWVYAPQPEPGASGILVYLNGREEPIPIEHVAFLGDAYDEWNPVEGWLSFSGAGSQTWAWVREAELMRWELAPQTMKGTR